MLELLSQADPGLRRQVGFVSGSGGGWLRVGTLSPYLQLEGQREALHPALEATGPGAQAVNRRHLVLVAEPRPGHQGARTQQNMVPASVGGEGDG